MKSSTPLAVLKAGTNVIAYISALFLAIAVILPIYFYPGYFLASVVNYAPFSGIVYLHNWLQCSAIQKKSEY